MFEPTEPYFPYPDWENDDRFTYLGSEENPETGMKYDYWIADTSFPGANRKATEYSYICRHSLEEGEYGSGPLLACVVSNGRSFIDMAKNYGKDFLFGLYRSQLFSLYFLATGEKPTNKK